MRSLCYIPDPRPPGCEKLSSTDKFRVRQGRFRIVYSVRDEALVVHVVKVARRKDVKDVYG